MRGAREIRAPRDGTLRVFVCYDIALLLSPAEPIADIAYLMVTPRCRRRLRLWRVALSLMMLREDDDTTNEQRDAMRY